MRYWAQQYNLLLASAVQPAGSLPADTLLVAAPSLQQQAKGQLTQLLQAPFAVAATPRTAGTCAISSHQQGSSRGVAGSSSAQDLSHSSSSSSRSSSDGWDAVASIPVLPVAVKPSSKTKKPYGLYGLHPLEPTQVPTHSSWGQVLRAGLATAASVRHDRQAAREMAAGSRFAGGAGGLSTELLYIPASDVCKLKVGARLGECHYCAIRCANASAQDCHAWGSVSAVPAHQCPKHQQVVPSIAYRPFAVGVLQELAGQHCRPSHDGSTVAYISTNDAVSSLVWVLMSYLRKRPLPGQPRPPHLHSSCLGLAVDLRTLSTAAASSGPGHMSTTCAGSHSQEAALDGPGSGPAVGGSSLSSAAGGGTDGTNQVPQPGVGQLPSSYWGSAAWSIHVRAVNPSSSATVAAPGGVLPGWSSTCSTQEWQQLCSDPQVLKAALAAGAARVRGALTLLRADSSAPGQLLGQVAAGTSAPLTTQVSS
jgi:hypothetical protein